MLRRCFSVSFLSSFSYYEKPFNPRHIQHEFFFTFAALLCHSSVQKLYETLDQKDRRISELELQLRRRTDQDSSMERQQNSWMKLESDRRVLASDVEKYRGESLKARDVIADLQARVTLYMEENDGLCEDKKQLQQQVESQKSIMDRQKQRILDMTKLSEETVRKQHEGFGEQYQLELENKRLHHIIMEFEENEQELVDEVDQLSQERRLMQNTHSDLNAKVNELLLQLDEQCKQSRALSLERGELLEKRSVMNESEIELKRLVVLIVSLRSLFLFDVLIHSDLTSRMNPIDFVSSCHLP